MPDARREGLKAAAEVVARVMRQVAGRRTQETAAAVNTRLEGEEAVVSGGREGGAYGWEPIQALMFDNDLRHPLFGNKRYWYHEGYFPITSYTESLSASDAAEAYAEVAVPLMLEEHGLAE